jgi:hypothetical protein
MEQIALLDEGRPDYETEDTSGSFALAHMRNGTSMVILTTECVRKATGELC